MTRLWNKPVTRMQIKYFMQDFRRATFSKTAHVLNGGKKEV